MTRRIVWTAVIMVGLSSCSPSHDYSQDYKEVGEALGYACGYIAGQSAAMTQFGATSKPGNVVDCDGVKANAVKHGFKP